MCIRDRRLPLLLCLLIFFGTNNGLGDSLYIANKLIFFLGSAVVFETTGVSGLLTDGETTTLENNPSVPYGSLLSLIHI